MTKIERYPHYVGLDDRELAAVLAGLRLVELLGFGDAGLDNVYVTRIGSSPDETARRLHDIYSWIYTNSGDDSLTHNEISALCERINMGTTAPPTEQTKTLSDPNHPQYDKGFDNGWHAGRRDAFATVFDMAQSELKKIGKADQNGTTITPRLYVFWDVDGEDMIVYVHAHSVQEARDQVMAADYDLENEANLDLSNVVEYTIHDRIPTFWNPHI